MTFRSPQLIGRQSVLADLLGELDRAVTGQGRVTLLAGEPGIGKSRLAEAIASAASERECTVAWGWCWEAGGAPAYWPWIQVLRGLLRERPPEQARAWLTGRAAELVQIVPEVAQRVDELRPLPSLGPEQARFRLLDAVCGALGDAAQARPIVLILEDLHIADPSTLAVLELLGRQVRTRPLFVLGTLRGLEGELAPVLTRLARLGSLVSLGRLGPEQVALFLREATGSEPSPAAVHAIHAKTEGNPLFLAEVTRLLIGQGGVERAAEVGVSIPGSIKQVVGERLSRLSAQTRAIVDVGAVLGREFERSVLAEVADCELETVMQALDEALDASVVEPVGTRTHRFTHILLREVAHAGLEPSERERLHARAARALSRAGSEVAWSEVAHHWLATGALDPDAVIDACRRAARAALERLAYAEAAQWFERALARGEASTPARGELLLGLADARIRGGDLEQGRDACEQAAALARQRGDAQLLARAALQAGALFRFAHVDAGLVRGLEEALEALPAHDSPLRARVMARLAAALQPAADPELPFALAREAIAMARRLADEPTLLAAIRSGCSALMDLAHPDERRALNREYVELAHRLGDDAEAFRGNARLVFDCYELADLAGAYAAIEACETLARRLDHPMFGWRVAAMRGMRAIREGRFADARAHAEQAEQLGQESGDPNVEAALLLQRTGWLRGQGRSEEVLALLPAVSALFPDSLAIPVQRVIVATELARMGQREQARAHLEPGDIEAVVAAGDRSLFNAMARYCFVTGDVALARAMLGRLAGYEAMLSSGGAFEMLWEEPLQLALGFVHLTLENTALADAGFERALAVARETGARAHEAQIALDWGHALRERAGAGESEWQRARACFERARALGEQMDAPAIVEAASRGLAGLSGPDVERAAPAISQLVMTREGDVWRIEHAGGTLRLKDTKGLSLLAQLVAEPGRELHVLDLVGSGSEAIDRGDAGALLDAQARRAYEHRVADLREQIAEAESFNDSARAERAQAELDAIAAELARAVGLGGRERRAGAAAERARINVQRRLRDAVRRIQRRDAGLGRHLERSVRTGTYCRYEPE